MSKIKSHLRLICLLVITLCYMSAFAFAKSLDRHACGLFLDDELGRGRGRVYRLIDLSAGAERALTTTIQNPQSALVQGLVSGLCYCLEGSLQSDPYHPEDDQFQLLKVFNVVQGPYSGCAPRP